MYNNLLLENLVVIPIYCTSQYRRAAGIIFFSRPKISNLFKMFIKRLIQPYKMLDIYIFINKLKNILINNIFKLLLFLNINSESLYSASNNYIKKQLNKNRI